MRTKAKAAVPLALALALGAASPAHALDAGSTIALSQPIGFGGLLDATAANSTNTGQSTSSDGTKVVFASAANGMSPDDNDTVSNIYLRDRVAHTTTLISRSTSGEPGNRDSFNPVISADGSRVAFGSNATNLAADDNDNGVDVFVRTVATGTTLLVSRKSAPDNAPKTGGGTPSISANGNKVAFATTQSYEADDTNGVEDVYVRDIANSTTELVSRETGPAGTLGTSESASGAISGNGERVAFATDSALDAAADTNATSDVYLRDVTTHTTTLISRANTATGAVGNARSQRPSLNNTGSRVAFESRSTNLTDDTDTPFDVFVRDLSSSTTLLVSRATGSTGASANANALGASIDLTGTKVAFSSGATNFGDGTALGTQPARVRDLGTDTTTVVSRASGVAGTIGEGFNASISPSGAFVTFGSTEPAFSADDANDFQQVYTRELSGGNPQTDLVSRPTGTGALHGGANSSRLAVIGRAISADGRYVVFDSEADGLSDDDDDDVSNVFRRDVLTGETVLVSRASGASGAPGTGDSLSASISADGDVVAFQSSAANLVDGDANGWTDVFVRRISTGTTELVSRRDGAGGAPGDNLSIGAAISGNGRFVAFTSLAPLTDDDADTDADIFRRDLSAGRTTLISRASGADGTNTNGFANSASIDDSGRYVAFMTTANNLDPADTGVDTDIYVRDADAATTTLVSRGDGAGPPAGGTSDETAISADGNRVAFGTSRAGLVSDDADTRSDVFVRDVAAGRTILASRAGSGALPTSDATLSSLSADGNRVGFATEAANVVPGAPLNNPYIAVRDIAAGTTQLGSAADAAAGGGLPDRLTTLQGALDASGHCMAFASRGLNLLPGGSGTGEFFNVYLHALDGPCPEPAPATTAPPPVPAGAGPIADTTAPGLAGTKITPTKFAVDKKSTPVSARAKKGAKFAWRLSEAAQVTFVIERSQPGRRKGRRCVKPTRKLRKARKCTRWVADGTLKRRATTGKGGTAFTGRIGRKALKPGKHRARITATDPAGNKSVQRTVTFTIVRR